MSSPTVVLAVLLLHLTNIPEVQATPQEGITDEVKDLYLLGLLPLGGRTWPVGDALKVAIDMALEAVNNRTDILDGYRLHLVVGDTQVKSSTHFIQIYVCLNTGTRI